MTEPLPALMDAQMISRETGLSESTATTLMQRLA